MRARAAAPGGLRRHLATAQAAAETRGSIAIVESRAVGAGATGLSAGTIWCVGWPQRCAYQSVAPAYSDGPLRRLLVTPLAGLPVLHTISRAVTSVMTSVPGRSLKALSTLE